MGTCSEKSRGWMYRAMVRVCSPVAVLMGGFLFLATAHLSEKHFASVLSVPPFPLPIGIALVYS